MGSGLHPPPGPDRVENMQTLWSNQIIRNTIIFPKLAYNPDTPTVKKRVEVMSVLRGVHYIMSNFPADKSMNFGHNIIDTKYSWLFNYMVKR